MAIHNWLREVAHAAYLSGVNVLAVQELFNCPFFVCTREKYPWMEFAENYLTGPTAELTKELAKKYNMVIVTCILERDEIKNTCHNTAVVTNSNG
jgi:beta-ureidopropionase